MYLNFEGLEQGEDIKIFKIFLVSPHPMGILNIIWSTVEDMGKRGGKWGGSGDVLG